MEVAWLAPMRQRWVARVRSQASELLTLGEAKKAVVAGGRKKTEPRDWIRELNQAAANSEVDLL
jgi:hypothetical protein